MVKLFTNLKVCLIGEWSICLQVWCNLCAFTRLYIDCFSFKEYSHKTCSYEAGPCCGAKCISYSSIPDNACLAPPPPPFQSRPVGNVLAVLSGVFLRNFFKRLLLGGDGIYHQCVMQCLQKFFHCKLWAGFDCGLCIFLHFIQSYIYVD